MFGTPPIIYNSITGITTPADAYYFDGLTTSYMTTSYSMNGMIDFTLIIQGTIEQENGVWCTMAGSASGSVDFFVGRNSSNQLTLQLYNDPDIAGHSVAWTNDFQEHIFGFRFDVTSGCSIWVDGINIGSDSDLTFDGLANETLQIGRRGTSDANMIGQMKVFKLWKSVVSDADMLSLGSNVNVGSADLDLNFNKTGTTWTDEATGGHNATVVGGVTLVRPKITMTTTSLLSAWNPIYWYSPFEMDWSTTGAVTTSASVTNDAPTLDFSANTGNADIFVTVEAPTFKDFTRFDLWATAGASNVQVIDISEIDPNSLQYINLRYAQLTDWDDITFPSGEMTALIEFVVRGNSQLLGFNTKTHLDAPNLEFLWVDVCNVHVDIEDMPLIDDVRWYDCNGAANYIRDNKDKVMTDLVTHGLSNGNVQMQDANYEITPKVKGAFDTLTARGWTLDMDRPDGIVFTTTSTSATYAPTGSQNVSTNTLRWYVTGPGLTPAEYNSNNPTMDLSSNTGTATISVESSDDLATLSEFWLWYSNLVDIDLEDATAITELNLRGNNATYTPTTIDITALTALTWFHADVMGLTSLNIDNNTALTELRIQSNSLPAAEQDYILATLNAHGQENGTLYMGTQSGSVTPTEDSYGDYIQLKDKGWFIDITVTRSITASTLYISSTSPREASARITGMYIRKDGKYISHVSDSPDIGYQYTCKIPFALRSISHPGGQYDFGTQVSTSVNNQGIRWKPDGTKFFVADLGLDGIQQYTCTTAWDITGTVTHNGEYNSSYHTNELTVDFNKDGTKMWVGAYNNERVWEYSLGTAWEVVSPAPTYVATHVIGGTAAGAQHMHYMIWFNEGKSVWLRFPEDNGDSSISYYSVSTAYDLSSTVTLVSSKNFGTEVYNHLSAMYYDEIENAWLLGDYQRDIMQLVRSTDDDEFTTAAGYCYKFPMVHDKYVGVIPYKMSQDGDFSAVVRVRMGGDDATVNNDHKYQAIFGSTSHNFMSWQFRRNSNNNLEMYIQVTSGGGFTTSGYSYGNQAWDGEWHVMGVTADAATGNVEMFFDGANVTSKTGTYDGWDQINDSDLNYEVFQLGDRARGSASMAGDLDYVKYYNSTLSVANMNTLTSDITSSVGTPTIELGNKKGKYFWYDDSGSGYHAGMEAAYKVPHNVIDFRGYELILEDGFIKDANGTTIGDGKVDVITTAANQYPFGTFINLIMADLSWVQITYTIQNYSTGEIRPCIASLSNDTGTSRSANGTYTDILFKAPGNVPQVQWANGATAVTSLEITNISIINLGKTAYQERDAAHPYAYTDTISGNWSGSGTTSSVDTVAFDTGTSSIKMVADTTNTSTHLTIAFDTTSGVDYSCKIRYKKGATSTSRAYIRNAANTGYIGTFSTIAYSASWADHTHTTFTADGATAYLRIYNTVANEGSPVSGDTFWIDSIIITKA